MPAPVIDTRTSLLAFEKGQVIATFQPVATNTPTSWSAAGLPTGLAINGTSGAITGTPTAAGFFGATLTATNGSGSDELAVIFAVYDTGSTVPADDIAVEIDIDLITGKVEVLGIPSGYEFGPPSVKKLENPNPAILLVKKGDRFPVTIGLKRNGVLQDIPVQRMRGYAKEFEPEDQLEVIGTGGFTKEGSGTTTRYRTMLYLSDADWAPKLANYEDDAGTYFDALAEIEFTVQVTGESYDDTKNTNLSPSLYGGAQQDDALVFTGLPEVSSTETYDLDLDLVITGRSAQNVSLTRTVDIEWDGLTFLVSNLTGTASGSGTDETAIGHWRTTFSHLSVVGTPTGITVNTRTAASDIADRYAIVIDCTENPDLTITSGALVTAGTASQPYEAQSTDGLDMDTFNLEHADLPADVKTTLNALASPLNSQVSDVFFDETDQKITVVLTSGTGVFAEIQDTVNTSTFSRGFQDGGDERGGTVQAQLSIGSITSTYRKTSETFLLRAERDLTEDS